MVVDGAGAVAVCWLIMGALSVGRETLIGEMDPRGMRPPACGDSFLRQRIEASSPAGAFPEIGWKF